MDIHYLGEPATQMVMIITICVPGSPIKTFQKIDLNFAFT